MVKQIPALTLLTVFNRLKYNPICILDSGLTFLFFGTVFYQILSQFYDIRISINPKNRPQESLFKNFPTPKESKMRIY